MPRTLTIKPTGLVLILATSLLSMSGCGLKGDLYFPEPETQAEEDAVEAENSELESKEQPVGISN